MNIYYILKDAGKNRISTFTQQQVDRLNKNGGAA